MIDYKPDEVLAYAETAFINKQYVEALKLYVLVLKQIPDDLLALSRAGSICVVLGRYKDAFHYFSHAVEVDPQNGDNYYNLGNAYYFHKEYDKCLEMYTQAERIGCSSEVTKKLYFQKAILCESRGDLQAALLYLNKYEKAYSGDVKAMDPRILSEKAKLHIALNDFEAAEFCAAKLVMIQPTVFSNYLIYFSMLMQQKKYIEAERVLNEAEECAVTSMEDKYTLGIAKASFYTELAETFSDDEDESANYLSRAAEIYEEMLSNPDFAGSKNEVKINIANLHMKAERYDEAIAILEEFLPKKEILHCAADLSDVPETPEYVAADEESDEPEFAETKEDDFDGYGENGFDDEYYGDETPDYFENEIGDDGYYGEEFADDTEAVSEESVDDEDDVTEESIDNEDSDEAESVDEISVKEDVSDDFIERVRYILMSCYVSKEDYLNALEMTGYLKDSQNTYYQYFSRYCEAYSVRSLSGHSELYTKEMGEQKYAETIAFYRSKMMKDPKDKYAIVLRARMYAEQGTYVKAEEMAKLLSTAERNALIQYIEKCRTSEKE